MSPTKNFFSAISVVSTIVPILFASCLYIPLAWTSDCVNIADEAKVVIERDIQSIGLIHTALFAIATCVPLAIDNVMDLKILINFEFSLVQWTLLSSVVIPCSLLYNAYLNSHVTLGKHRHGYYISDDFDRFILLIFQCTRDTCGRFTVGISCSQFSFKIHQILWIYSCDNV